MNIVKAMELLKKVKMTDSCNGCKNYHYCNNNNLLCRKQVMAEFNKAALEETYNKGEEK